jgi:Ser/Thr protein kinase RdoA (MazF antagonist)
VTVPQNVLSRFGLSGAELTQIPTGLIHKTFRADTSRGRFTVQSVNKIFSPLVNEDIDAATSHVAKKGLLTPRLVRTEDGAAFAENEGEIWRVLTWIDGETIERVETPGDAEQAAALLGRFHKALSDFDYQFKARRLGVHDTPKHLATLKEAVATHGSHRLAKEVAPVAKEILDRASSLPDLSSMPERIVHGDPKISNVVFRKGQAAALIDLDTIAPMRLALELGDAIRSWCNPAGEDATKVEFSLPIFSAALAGYGSEARDFIRKDEIEVLAAGARMIMIELSARFCADALNERYFGWDPRRFSGRGEHNLLRAKGQLALAKDFEARRAEAERAVTSAFAT